MSYRININSAPVKNDEGNFMCADTAELIASIVTHTADCARHEWMVSEINDSFSVFEVNEKEIY